ncbi:MAG: endonuclease III [Bacteroidales bacterium]|nr:endonuclease III [Bacteroidales bacterium]
MTKKERYEKVFSWFKQNMANVETELNFHTPFQLLVAVMLSAQCTDKRVNMVTPALFAAFPDADAMSKATEEEIFAFVKSVTYPNAKSRHLLEAAKIIAGEYNGEIPDDDKKLQRLPGVGRKTAHVVQAVLYRRPEMPVDTHVFRV